MMTHASLFSGIGGFDLAAEWAGWTNAFNCEIDLFCRRILKYHFPNAVQYGDIKTTDFTVWRDRIDVLTGGFPCQPFSLAGKRKGTADDRHLWPQMLRAIREIRPRWIVAENVFGIVNWSDGMVFEQVHLDLETAGYEVQSFVLPACGVGAPHRRDRCWFVAHRTDAGVEAVREGNDRVSAVGVAANADNERCEKCVITQKSGEKKRQYRKTDIERTIPIPDWQGFPTESPVRGGNDGFPGELDCITLSKWCRDSIKAYGNAIVPQVALQIFEAINEYENYLRNRR